EQRRGGVVEEEVVERVVQLGDVDLVAARRRVTARAFLRAPPEHLGRRLKVDHEVGRRQVGGEQVVQALIDEQLVVVEVQVREDLVLVEQIVADGDLREQ